MKYDNVVVRCTAAVNLMMVGTIFERTFMGENMKTYLAFDYYDAVI